MTKQNPKKTLTDTPVTSKRKQKFNWRSLRSAKTLGRKKVCDSDETELPVESEWSETDDLDFDFQEYEPVTTRNPQSNWLPRPDDLD